MLPPRKDYMTSRCGTFAYRQGGGGCIKDPCLKTISPKTQSLWVVTGIFLFFFFASAHPPIYKPFMKSYYNILLGNDDKKRRAMHVQHEHDCFPSIFNLLLIVSSERGPIHERANSSTMGGNPMPSMASYINFRHHC